MSKFKIGDVVRVVDAGKTYSTYGEFLTINDISPDGFVRGETPPNGDIGVILFSGNHPLQHTELDFDCPLYVIFTGGSKYIIEEDGLELFYEKKEDCKNDIVKFVREKCDFECQQNNVIKIVEMILSEINKIKGDIK